MFGFYQLGAQELIVTTDADSSKGKTVMRFTDEKGKSMPIEHKLDDESVDKLIALCLKLKLEQRQLTEGQIQNLIDGNIDELVSS